MNDMLRREIACNIAALAPGQAYMVSSFELEEIGSAPLLGFFGPTWSPADWIMEAIAGSVYEFEFSEDPVSRGVIFYRLKEPLNDGRRTHVSPDRRHLFERVGRYFRPIAQPNTGHSQSQQPQAEGKSAAGSGGRGSNPRRSSP